MIKPTTNSTEKLGLLKPKDVPFYMPTSLAPGATQVDQGTLDQIAEGLVRAGRAESDYMSEDLAGTAAPVVGYAPEASSFSPTMIDPDAFNSALEQRSQRLHQDKLRQLERASLVGAHKRKAQELEQAGQNIGNVVSLKQEQIQQKQQYDIQMRQLALAEAEARGSILSQILGGALSGAAIGLDKAFGSKGGGTPAQGPSSHAGQVAPMGGDQLIGSVTT